MTCDVIPPYAKTNPGTEACFGIQLAEQFCCPGINQTSTGGNATLDTATGNSTTTSGTCPFCLDKLINKDIAISEFDTNCAEMEMYASSLDVNTDPCNEILPAEAICCA